MRLRRTDGVRIAGIACAIPNESESVEELALAFGQDEAQKTAKTVGVQKRHIAADTICSSDLCYAAASRLLQELEWKAESIETLLFVSQTPDYVLPATSCVLHGRLGLASHCASLDINLGCSGYVYGLWVATKMARAQGAGRTLLLVGDTPSKFICAEDRSVVPLFGDAGSATAIEADEEGGPLLFDLGTDGSGAEHLIIRAGGFRERSSEATRLVTERPDGCRRSAECLEMNGGEIFNFSLDRVPPMVRGLAEEAYGSLEGVDYVVLHQANLFMLQYLAKRLKLPREKMPLSLEQYGNTSSATIPLTMATSLRETLQGRRNKLILAGFGVGLSWGGVAMETGPMVIPEVEAVA